MWISYTFNYTLQQAACSMTTRKVEYRVRCLSGPGREDAYESPIPIPPARFGQLASMQLQGLKNAFTVSFRKGPSVVL